MPKIIIAIDGHSSCGKSTLARALARALGYTYIDSGAMYRAVTLYFLQNGIPAEDESAVSTALERIQIGFEKREEKIRILLNGADIEEQIRQMRVSERVSEVAAISAVRRALVDQQRLLGKNRGIVMDGRDIGTVVFPDAELKIFLTADEEERVRRRYLELLRKGQGTGRDTVRDNLRHRDRIDSNRNDSPLRKAADAVVIDNTNLSETEQLAMSLALARERIRNRKRSQSQP